MQQILALALFSGGLDSILACRVLAEQGIQVKALKFVTPFFGHDLLCDPIGFQKNVWETYRIQAELVDLSDQYLELLRQPKHGFGKNFNPCIDCKILMLQRAKKLMADYGASFLITGEVLGQRPMSQRQDTLNLIEREAGCRDILLRPLSAKRLRPTLAEQQGLVDREHLYAFSGRGRSQQIALAKEFGITNFPAPAGGCILTDPNLSRRIQRFYSGLYGSDPKIGGDSIRLLLLGRQFCLPGGHCLVLGRDEQENQAITGYSREKDWLLFMPEHPGPTALLRLMGEGNEEELLAWAAGLVVRFGKKTGPTAKRVFCQQGGKEQWLRSVVPLEDSLFKEWIL
jgi:tRNA-uridine 2-sulfurtransferase